MSVKDEGMGGSDAVDSHTVRKCPCGCRIIYLDIKCCAGTASSKSSHPIGWCKPGVERLKPLLDLTKARNLHRALVALFADLIFLRCALCLNQGVDNFRGVQTTTCI